MEKGREAGLGRGGAAATEASADRTGSSEAGVALHSCPAQGTRTEVLDSHTQTSHWVGLPLRSMWNLRKGSYFGQRAVLRGEVDVGGGGRWDTQP